MDALPAALDLDLHSACQPPWLLRDLSGVAYRHRPGRSPPLETLTLQPLPLPCAAPLALPVPRPPLSVGSCARMHLPPPIQPSTEPPVCPFASSSHLGPRHRTALLMPGPGAHQSPVSAPRLAVRASRSIVAGTVVNTALSRRWTRQ